MQDRTFLFLYEAEGLMYLMNPKTLEETTVSKSLLLPELHKVLEGGAEVKVRMAGERAVMVHGMARSYRCTVAEVLERRDSSDGRKSTTVITQGGLRVVCPAAVNEGDQIMVSLPDHEYQGKV